MAHDLAQCNPALEHELPGVLLRTLKSGRKKSNMSPEAERLIAKKPTISSTIEKALPPVKPSPAEVVAIIKSAAPDLPGSQGKTVAYATRRIGSTWPGPVWTKCRENVIVPPEFELVRVTIEPVE